MPIQTVLPEKDRHINVWRPQAFRDVDSVGRFLRKARVMRRLTQQQAAKRAGVAKSAISNYETRAGHDWKPQSWISVPVFIRVVNALGYELVLVPRQEAMPDVSTMDIEGPPELYEGRQL